MAQSEGHILLRDFLKLFTNSFQNKLTQGKLNYSVPHLKISCCTHNKGYVPMARVTWNWFCSGRDAAPNLVSKSTQVPCKLGCKFLETGFGIEFSNKK